MFAGTPAQLREREQRARTLAQQVASLLPSVDIRNVGGKWSVR